MMRSRMGLWLAATSFCVVAGCNAILGNEEGTPKPSATNEAGAFDASTVDGDTSDAKEVADATFDAALTCPVDKKACTSFHACVVPTDPNFGCGDPSCNACDTSNADSVACAGSADAGQIVCKPTCKAGFKDCDGKPDNGCEADLSKAATCGDCNIACGAGATLCAKNGSSFSCVSSCPGALTQCGTECVDLETSAAHCGACGTGCAAPPNATATCTAHVCGFKCETLYHQCADRCVADSNVNACGAGCIDCLKGAPPNMVPSCQSGQCKYECAPGFGDCNGNVQDGCEIDVRNDNANCGKCTNACGGVVLNLSPTLIGGTYCCNGSCILNTQVCKVPQ